LREHTVSAEPGGHTSCSVTVTFAKYAKYSVMDYLSGELLSYILSCHIFSLDSLTCSLPKEMQLLIFHSAISNQQSRETVVGTSASITVSSVTTLNSTF